MKVFVRRLLFFLSPFMALSLVALFLLPTTPRASKSLLMAAVKKDSLLQNVLPPRIIFLGASNLSFGINSQMIKDSLGLNPINTGIHADIGTKFVLEHSLQYIQAGDVIILVIVYQDFYRSYSFGSEELFRVIFDVQPKNVRYLDIYQLLNIIEYIPQYTLSKFDIREYTEVVEDPIYGINSFNSFGDVDAHWGREKQDFSPYTIKDKFNSVILHKIKDFENKIINKNAELYVSFPAYHEVSYQNSTTKIHKVESEYKSFNFKVLGNPKRYVLDDSMFFNTPYHLNKKGMDLYTSMFIQDFKKSQSNIWTIQMIQSARTHHSSR